MDALFALTPFLATPEQLAESLRASTSFREFLALATKSSGADPHRIDMTQARYRVADGSNLMREGLAIDSRVPAGGRETVLRELLTAHAEIDRDRLIHALWQLDSFEELKEFLIGLRCIVRYSHDLDGQLHGHVVLAETLLPMIESVERRQYVLANGDMASDAISRNLGLRAKVFALDKTGVRPNMMATGMFDRLTRNIGRFGR